MFRDDIHVISTDIYIYSLMLLEAVSGHILKMLRADSVTDAVVQRYRAGFLITGVAGSNPLRGMFVRTSEATQGHVSS